MRTRVVVVFAIVDDLQPVAQPASHPFADQLAAELGEPGFAIE